MRDHIKILGILNIVMGGLSAAIGVAAIMIFGGFSVAASLLGRDSGTPSYAPLWALIAIAIGSFFIVLSLPSLVGGWGLLKFKPWSRVVMIVVSALHLLNLPLGTAAGIYGLWVLTNRAIPPVARKRWRHAAAFHPDAPGTLRLSSTRSALSFKAQHPACAALHEKFPPTSLPSNGR